MGEQQAPSNRPEPQGSEGKTDGGSRHVWFPQLRNVDVRWALRSVDGGEITSDDRDGYLAGHIPGAVFAGMSTELADPVHAVTDMLAPPDRCARVMGRLVIGHATLIVTDDVMGVPLASTRLWWALSH